MKEFPKWEQRCRHTAVDNSSITLGRTHHRLSYYFPNHFHKSGFDNHMIICKVSCGNIVGVFVGTLTLTWCNVYTDMMYTMAWCAPVVVLGSENY